MTNNLVVYRMESENFEAGSTMAKLIFLEGISGVGKSTMARSLCKDLQTNGLSAKAYIEFDYTNPIDFYCVAYYPTEEYETLLAENHENETSIRANTIDAGSARLIHYFDEDTPLFEEPLLSVFMEREFCYNPRNPVSLEKYSDAYVAVWKNFAANLILFRLKSTPTLMLLSGKTSRQILPITKSSFLTGRSFIIRSMT